MKRITYQFALVMLAASSLVGCAGMKPYVNTSTKSIVPLPGAQQEVNARGSARHAGIHVKTSHVAHHAHHGHGR